MTLDFHWFSKKQAHVFFLFIIMFVAYIVQTAETFSCQLCDSFKEDIFLELIQIYESVKIKCKKIPLVKAIPRHKGPGSLVMMLLVAVGLYFKHYFYQGDAD